MSADAFAKLTIFAGLDESALRFLADKAHRLELKAGTVVVREGDQDNHLFLIESGAVRICKNHGTSRELELTRLAAGSCFGEMSILDTLPRSATVETSCDATLFRLSSMAFLDLYDHAPAQYGLLVLNIARDLSRRLRRLDETFAALS